MRELCYNYRDLFTPAILASAPPIVFLYVYQAKKPDIRVSKKDVLYFMHGMPSWLIIKELYEKHASLNSGYVLIFDDCLSDLESLTEDETEKLTRLVTQWSRHRNMSLYFTLQNAFVKSRVIRVLRSNLEQLLLFSVTSGQSSVYLLLSKLLGSENSKITRAAYHRAVRLSKGHYYGYLAIDFRTHSEIINKYRIRNFFASFAEDKRTGKAKHKVKRLQNGRSAKKDESETGSKQKKAKFRNALTRPDMYLYQLKH